MATGDQSGTWGNTTNFNLGTLMEQAIASYVTQQFSSADVTLTLVNGSDAGGNTTPGTIYTAGTVAVPVSARNMYIECQGTSTGNNLIVPTNTKLYYVYNNISSGGGTITVKTASGTGVAIPVGQRAAVVCNGTNVVLAANYFTSLVSPSVAFTGGTIDGIAIGSSNASTVKGTTITATSQFSGPGTGLTGTAAGLSIGGSAATATSATTATTATNLSGGSVAATTITASGSTVLGSPTGGSQGAGTLNATGIYVNGVAVGTGSGSVTSVAMSVPAFLSVSGSPITSSGTFAVSLSGTALPVLNGGTGATTAAGALSNLGAYAASNPSNYVSSGANISVFTNNANYVSSGANISVFTNNVGYLTGITSSQVTTALGYTPYNSSNPSGYITSSGSITGTSSNITAYTINQNVGSSNSPTFAGITYNGGGGFPHYASSTYSSGAITVQSGGSPSGGSSGDIFFIY
jgi:hypothetical protein